MGPLKLSVNKNDFTLGRLKTGSLTCAQVTPEALAKAVHKSCTDVDAQQRHLFKEKKKIQTKR